MTKFRKAISFVLTLSSSLTLSGVGLATQAYGAQLKSASVTPFSNVSAASTTYHFAFTTNVNQTLDKITLVFATTASGSVTKPSNFNVSSPSISNLTVNGSPVDANGVTAGDADVTVDGSFATSGLVTLVASANNFGAASNIPVSFDMSGITNVDATISGAGECDNIASSESCYTRITTYHTSGTIVADSASVTFTNIVPTTVTATVDPSLTFTVNGVASGSVASNDATNSGCATGTTNVTSTATAIDFANIRLGLIKCAQHDIRVATNATSFIVYHKFIGASVSANMMVGATNGANNIDPFTSAFTAPGAWSTPSGSTASVNSGWLGIRSSAISAFANSDYYAGPEANNSNSVGSGNNKVMDSATPNLGTTPTYVTYKLQVNALQPADQYTGTMTYIVVATY